MRKNVLFSILLSSLLLVGAGCAKVQVTTNDGGVFKSFDRGAKWEQRTGLLSVGQPKTISNINVANLYFNPQDSNLMYLVSRDGKLFVSYDAAESWQEMGGVPKGNLNTMAIDSQYDNVVYLGIGGKVFKSNNCCRSWQNVYLEALPGVEVTSLAIDNGDNHKILAGLSDGRLLRSGDAGINWSTFYDFRNKIVQILVNPNNSGILYVNTRGGGIWRSIDGGNSWQNLDNNMKAYGGARDAILMLFNPAGTDSLIISSDYGLLWSNNGGQDWSDYKLLFQPKKTPITAFAFNTKNPNEIYFTTNNTFYRSFDGGNKWQTKSLPSKRTPTVLLVDPNNPANLYLGLARIEK